MSKPMLAESSSQDFLARPLREVSFEELSRLFLDSAKPNTQWYVGTEVELFAFHQNSYKPVEHSDLGLVLDGLASELNLEREFEVNDALVGLKGNGMAISLEPGGQLEFASSPHSALKALRSEMQDYITTLSKVAADRSIGFWALGLQPLISRSEAPVMPKPRYEIMRKYLPGARALDMMHRTGSVQVTVDFQDELNLINKMRTAAKVSPFLSALVAASPFTRGENRMALSLYDIKFGWKQTISVAVFGLRCSMKRV